MKNLLILFSSLVLSLLIQAQPPKSQKEKIESLRIAFITNKLALTPDEAKTFWPVYNQYTKELENLRKNFKSSVDLESVDFTKLTNAEAEKTINEVVGQKQAELDIQKKYVQEFKKVLPATKVLLLLKTEADFRKLLLEKLKEKGDKAPNEAK